MDLAADLEYVRTVPKEFDPIATLNKEVLIR